jgi:hypothetical protein
MKKYVGRARNKLTLVFDIAPGFCNPLSHDMNVNRIAEAEAVMDDSSCVSNITPLCFLENKDIVTTARFQLDKSLFIVHHFHIEYPAVKVLCALKVIYLNSNVRESIGEREHMKRIDETLTLNLFIQLSNNQTRAKKKKAASISERSQKKPTTQ